jgi:hypothetical protein
MEILWDGDRDFELIGDYCSIKRIEPNENREVIIGAGPSKAKLAEDSSIVPMCLGRTSSSVKLN